LVSATADTASRGRAKARHFRPPCERLECERIHQGIGARKAVDLPHMRKFDNDFSRALRQQVFLQGLLQQKFDFSSLLADLELVQFSGEEALRELAAIDATWRMQTFARTRLETINGMMVLVKGGERVSLDT